MFLSELQCAGGGDSVPACGDYLPISSSISVMLHAHTLLAPVIWVQWVVKIIMVTPQHSFIQTFVMLHGKIHFEDVIAQIMFSHPPCLSPMLVSQRIPV